MFGQPPDDLLESARDAAGERREAFGEEQDAQRFVFVIVVVVDVTFAFMVETICVRWKNERKQRCKQCAQSNEFMVNERSESVNELFNVPPLPIIGLNGSGVVFVSQSKRNFNVCHAVSCCCCIFSYERNIREMKSTLLFFSLFLSLSGFFLLRLSVLHLSIAYITHRRAIHVQV